MGKYLDIFRSVAVAGSAAEQPRSSYDINDINDKRSDLHGRDATFGRLCRFGRTLQELEHRCPAYIEAADWQQAIEGGRRFVTKWGEQAETLGWTSADLFGLHTPPEKPAPSYRRLSRYDQTGLIWLLRGRSVIALTSTEAVILCHSGATLKFCRSTEAALAEITKVTPAAEINEAAPAKEIDSAVALYRPTKAALAEITEVAPAKEIDSAGALYRPTEAAFAEITETINAMAQIGKPTPVGVIDAPALAKQGLGDAHKPDRRNADAASHAEARHVIPEDLSIPEFLRREKDDVAGKAVA
jgi:hypothetical protein